MNQRLLNNKTKGNSLQPNNFRRDPLKISLPMGYVIIFAGYFSLFLQSVFAGFSLFMVICNYAIMGSYEQMSYYSGIAPNLSFLNVYISIISLIINSTYTAFAWILLPNKIGNIILTMSIVIGIITFALSLTLISTSQIFYAMTSRNPNWFQDPNFDPDGEWKKSAFTPYQIKDIARCIFFIIQALLFIVGHQIASTPLITAFDLTFG